MSVLSRLKSLVVKTAEGEVGSPPFPLPVSGGWVTSSEVNWWQRGFSIEGSDRTAMIEACISAYSQTVAMLPGDHWLRQNDGGRKRVETSSLSRILRQGPNDYQTMSDFMLNLVDNLYAEGNGYAIALRNYRGEVQELHLMNPRQCMPRIAPQTGDVFYSLGGNPIVDYKLGPEAYPLLVPARDVLHIKLRHSPFNILRGESPILSAARDVAASNAILTQQIAFYTNQARPSMVLSSDLTLTPEQIQQIRDRWNEQAKHLGAGGTVILGAGMKPLPMSVTPVDAQLAEVMKMSDQKIALAFRVPLQLLGMSTTTFASTESLMQFWLASGLQFCINHIELAFDSLFGLSGQPNEYVEFDVSVLLRSEMKNRIEAFARSVTSGIHSPNEARAAFDLKRVDAGDEPRMQAQNVPLTAAENISAIPAAPPAPAALPAPKELTDVEQQRLRSTFRSSQSRHLAL